MLFVPGSINGEGERDVVCGLLGCCLCWVLNSAEKKKRGRKMRKGLLGELRLWFLISTFGIF